MNTQIQTSHEYSHARIFKKTLLKGPTPMLITTRLVQRLRPRKAGTHRLAILPGIALKAVEFVLSQ
jgi:hypothetical protein